MNIRIELETENVYDLIFASRSVNYLLENPKLKDAYLLYGEPAKYRIIIKRTKSGFSLKINNVEPLENVLLNL